MRLHDNSLSMNDKELNQLKRMLDHFSAHQRRVKLKYYLTHPFRMFVAFIKFIFDWFTKKPAKDEWEDLILRGYERSLDGTTTITLKKDKGFGKTTTISTKVSPTQKTRLAEAREIAKIMQSKNMIAGTPDALKEQVNEILKMDREAMNTFRAVVEKADLVKA